MKRIVTAGLLAAFAGVVLQTESAPAQKAAPGVRVAQAGTVYVAPPRKLRRVPVYPRDHYDPDVYPRYNPGPNAVRECNAYLCAGSAAERHGDHPAHELLLAARLVLSAVLRSAPISPAPTTSADAP